MSTILDLGKLRFLFRGVYANGTAYETNDVVTYGGNTYVYISNTAGSGNVPTDTTYWSKMVDGLSAQAGSYNNSATYQANDLVKVSGIVYRCLQTTTGVVPPNAANWEVFVEGFAYKSDWSSATQYYVNDIAVLNGINYIATANNLNSEPPSANWAVFAAGFQDKGDWDSATDYEVNDLVTLNGVIYRCTADSTNNEPPDNSYWVVFAKGFNHTGAYNAATAYKINDLLEVSGRTYRCTAASTGNEPPHASFSVFVDGYKHKGAYNAATAYKINDIVVVNGVTYRCTTASTGNEPPHASFEEYILGFKLTGAWSNSAAYKLNDLASHGGSLYRAKVAHTGSEPPNGTNWESYIEGYNRRTDNQGLWATSTDYNVNDTVSHLNHTYQCILDHTSTSDFYTDFITSSNWVRLTAGLKNRGGYSNGVSYFVNDITTVGSAPNMQMFINLYDHVSSGAAPTNDGSNWTKIQDGQITGGASINAFAYFVGVQ